MIKPFWTDGDRTIYCGDCREILPQLKGTGVVTDPPYELGFMGKDWDKQGVSFQKETWQIIRESCLPGAMLLSFGGTRTFHRIACAIEDAGWELRDTIMWLYGSGFPKSLDISKAIDKQFGVEREVVGKRISAYGTDTATGERVSRDKGGAGLWVGKDAKDVELKSDSPTTPEAQLWSGYGTALKPAYEPILICMNPLDGTFANNALKHRVAGLNIDGCRVDGAKGNGIWGTSNATINTDRKFNASPSMTEYRSQQHPQGRFPANIIHDGSEEVLELFPNPHGAGYQREKMVDSQYNASSYDMSSERQMNRFGDSGSAARFFYCAKASKSERGEGNNHPTVKPLALMKYLVKLISPPKDAVIIDPFMGSGTTLIACKELGIKCIGIDTDEYACEIAVKRCQAANRCRQEVMELKI